MVYRAGLGLGGEVLGIGGFAMDLVAVAQSRLSNALRALYQQIFTDRYKIAPELSDDDSKIFSWLASKFDEQKGREIIRSYFALPDRYLIEKAFPAKFIKSNINQILAALGTKESLKPKGALRMQIPLTCDKCHQPFLWIGTAEELDKNPRICKDCWW